MNINSSVSAVSHIHSLAADFLINELKSLGFEDFSSSHGNILFQLSKNNRMLMGEMAKAINRDKSTTTVLVRKLERLGYLEISSSENDKRSKYLSLTQKGLEYNKAMEKISSHLQEKFYKGFSEDEKIIFCSFLERISNNFL